MNHNYEDLRSKIKEEPQWFDENAVPRYCEFAPDKLADIYADECALVLISCQACGQEFKVAFSQDKMGAVRWMMMYGKDKPIPTIAEGITSGRLHYGDPPNIECCGAGPTMNCDDIRVLEYWIRERFDWVRKQEFEVELDA